MEEIGGGDRWRWRRYVEEICGGDTWRRYVEEIGGGDRWRR